MKQSEAGKGSKQRPTDTNKYYYNYDLIFGKKKIVIGEDVPPMTEDRIEELNKVLDQYET